MKGIERKPEENANREEEGRYPEDEASKEEEEEGEEINHDVANAPTSLPPNKTRYATTNETYASPLKDYERRINVSLDGPQPSRAEPVMGQAVKTKWVVKRTKGESGYYCR